MNREYAYNRDKGKCKCCSKILIYNSKTCHHINNNLPIDKINKVSNLVWVCNDCYNAIHTGLIPVNTETKTKNKILKYQAKLNAKSVSSN